MEVRDLAKRSEASGACPAWALSIKVRHWGTRLAQGPVDKREGFGGKLAGPGPANRCVLWWMKCSAGAVNKVDVANYFIKNGQP